MFNLKFSNRHRAKAFSLIELMVVISILAVLLVMGITNGRKHQIRSTSNNEVERFTSQLKLMPSLAKNTGVLCTGTLAKPIPVVRTAINSKLGIKNTTGRFRWKSYQNGVLQNTEILGSRQDINVKISDVFSSSYKGAIARKLVKGAWMELWTVSGSKDDDATLFAEFVFLPNGTPLNDGEMEISLVNDGHKKKAVMVYLEKMGGVKVEIE